MSDLDLLNLKCPKCNNSFQTIPGSLFVVCTHCNHRIKVNEKYVSTSAVKNDDFLKSVEGFDKFGHDSAFPSDYNFNIYGQSSFDSSSQTQSELVESIHESELQNNQIKATDLLASSSVPPADFVNEENFSQTEPVMKAQESFESINDSSQYDFSNYPNSFDNKIETIKNEESVVDFSSQKKQQQKKLEVEKVSLEPENSVPPQISRRRQSSSRRYPQKNQNQEKRRSEAKRGIGAFLPIIIVGIAITIGVFNIFYFSSKNKSKKKVNYAKKAKRPKSRKVPAKKTVPARISTGEKRWQLYKKDKSTKVPAGQLAAFKKLIVDSNFPVYKSPEPKLEIMMLIPFNYAGVARYKYFWKYIKKVDAKYLKKSQLYIVPLPYSSDKAKREAEYILEIFSQKGIKAAATFVEKLIAGPSWRSSNDLLDLYAKKTGVDMTALKRALATKKHENKIKAAGKFVKDLKIPGTSDKIVYLIGERLFKTTATYRMEFIIESYFKWELTN
ncbi:MAG: hypothetical protein PF689_08160 [Deltaproteobacteria bacterium]|jgi:DNA-directed RNA polymerase subunit RPC12/RpoP|nr:hypothetical protein [Deltaproteobacteria bacterium]